MITKKNYFSQVSSIDYKSLPDALKEGYDTIKFGSKEYTTWEYLDDDPEFLDVYFEKLNSFLDKEKKTETKAEKAVKKVSKTAKPKTEKETKKPVAKKEKADKKKKKPASPKSKPEKKKPAKAEKPAVTPVEKVQEEIRFIKRYILLQGREKTRSQILSFINALQKAIIEKRIRKTSAYAEEIIHIQEQLVNCYNKMGEVVKIEIKEDTLDKFIAIAGGEKTMMSVLFIKRYISLHGKANVKVKAERLFNQMKRAADKKKVTSSDPYKEKLELIYNSLNDYITGKTETPAIQKAELNGLKELALMKLFSKKKA